MGMSRDGARWPLWSYKHPIWGDPAYQPTPDEAAWLATVERRFGEWTRARPAPEAAPQDERPADTKDARSRG